MSRSLIRSRSRAWAGAALERRMAHSDAVARVAPAASRRGRGWVIKVGSLVAAGKRARRRRGSEGAAVSPQPGAPTVTVARLDRWTGHEERNDEATDDDPREAPRPPPPGGGRRRGGGPAALRPHDPGPVLPERRGPRVHQDRGREQQRRGVDGQVGGREQEPG